MSRWIALVLGASISSAGAARAADLCVHPTGSGGCYSTVAAATAAAAPIGDVVTIAAGTYLENVTIAGKSVEIVGAGAGATVLDGGYLGPVIDLRSGSRLRLSGVTLQRGTAGLRGFRSTAYVDATRLRENLHAVSDQDDDSGEDGLFRVFIESSTIEDNQDGIELLRRSKLRLRRSSFVGNGYAGAFSLIEIGDASSFLVEDSTFSGNDCGFRAVIELVQTLPEPRFVSGRGRVERSTFAENDCISVDAYGPLRVHQSILQGCPEFSVKSTGLNFWTTHLPCTQTHHSDVSGTDPQLAALTDNGGPTLTHLPLPGSPVLGQVTRRALCREPDQRGVPRGTPCASGAVDAP